MGGYGFPARPVPWWVLWVVGPDATPPMERATVYNNVDVPINFDHSKAKRELGIQFDRPLVKTLEDMIDQLLDLGVVEGRERHYEQTKTKKGNIKCVCVCARVLLRDIIR